MFTDRDSILEIGVDEVGRGPLFGRVYAAAVVLPADFDALHIRDSKRIKNKRKMASIAEHIKTHATAWSIQWESEQVVDEINILQASQRAMHNAILDVVAQLKAANLCASNTSVHVLVDGTYFNALPDGIQHSLVAGGDAIYVSIAAASILAKHARDTYILELCAQHPVLVDRYKLNTNMGYGTPAHIQGIRQFGLTEWHRKSFRTGKQPDSA